MNENEIIKYALKERLLADIDFYNSYPDHRFSHRFTRKMRKLLKGNIHSEVKIDKFTPLKFKIKYAIIAAIVAVLFIGASFGVYMLWQKYQVKDYGLYSMLHISEAENAPKILEEKYEIGCNLSNYEKTVYLDIENQYFVEYHNYSNDIGISFEQSTYEVGEQTFINTENALVMPCEIMINGYEGIYFETYYGGKCIIWCTEDYVFSVTGAHISKNDLIYIAENVKKAE